MRKASASHSSRCSRSASSRTWRAARPTPFIDRKALGGVAGIVGAGGNVGAVAASFLLKGVGDVQHTLGLLGLAVTATALCAMAVRFSEEHKAREAELRDRALAAGSVAN